jgi:hypothetical protein
MTHGGGRPGRWGEDGRTNSPLGEKLMWKGAGRVAGEEWMVGERRATRTRGEGWMSTRGSRGKAGRKMT